MVDKYKAIEELLTQTAIAIGPLIEKVAFIGGATTILHLVDKVTDVRLTIDVDLIIDASVKVFQDAEAELRRQGFQPDPKLICRHKKGDLIVDLMPTDPKILGFSSRWYGDAIRNAEKRHIGGIEIKAMSFPYFVATKLEAFRGRGGGDYHESKDIEDLITVFAARPRFLIELKELTGTLGTYIRAEFKDHVSQEAFATAVSGNRPRDATVGVERILADLRELADL